MRAFVLLLFLAQSVTQPRFGTHAEDDAADETFYLRASGDNSDPETIGGAFNATGVNSAANWASINSDDGKIGPGDSIIVLDDDGPIRAEIYPAGSGLSGQRITYQGEDGGTAKITGMDIVTGWTNEPGTYSWTTLVTDGFESGTSSAWSLVFSAPVFDATAARTGSFGMHANNDTMYVGDDSGAATHSRRLVYYFKCISETLADEGSVGIAEIRPLENTVVYMHQDSGTLYLDLDDSTGAGLENSVAIVTGTWYKIELIISRQINSRLWVDDVLVDTEAAAAAQDFENVLIQSNRGTPTSANTASDDAIVYSAPAPTANVWSATLAVQPHAYVLFDGSPGTEVTTACPSTLTTSGQWCWTGGVLYTYRATDPDLVTVEAAQRNYVLRTDHSYLTFTGFAVQGANGGYGGVVTGTFEDFAPTELTFNDLDVAYNRGVGVHWGEFCEGNLVFSNSRIHHNESHGMNPYRHLSTADARSVITSNEIDNNGAYGIFLFSAYSTVEYNHVHHNGTATELGCGISAYSDPEDGPHGDHNIIRWNVVHDSISASSDGCGISTDHYADDCEISGNVVYANDVGIGMYASKNLLVYNNTVYGNSVAPGGNYGELSVSDDPYFRISGLVIRNNVFMSTGNVAVQMRDMPYTGTVMNDNIFYRAAGNWWEYNTSTVGATLAGWQAAASLDANSLNSNPLLTNPTTDFTLQAGSPAKDVGASLGLTADIVGTAIPQGSGPDMGAYERP